MISLSLRPLREREIACDAQTVTDKSHEPLKGSGLDQEFCAVHTLPLLSSQATPTRFKGPFPAPMLLTYP